MDIPYFIIAKALTMRKLIMEEWVSLDGYVTDKNDKLDFFTHLTPEENKYSDLDQLSFLDGVDTILLGRKTYELFVEFWPTATTAQEAIADKLNSIKKIVFSNTLHRAPWGQWPDLDILRGDAIEQVKTLKSLPGKSMVIWGSISLVQALSRAQLIDEYHIQLCPVLTGGGRRLFQDAAEFNKLHQTELRRYNTGVVFLNYSSSAP